MQDGLVLRDVHRPPAPPFWPPAPGWWFLAFALIAILGTVWTVRRRRMRRRASWEARFDAAVAEADTPSARLARASELLRRAARRARTDADRLDGEAWLSFLDTPTTRFVDGPGRLILEGPFRATVDAAEARDALALARVRFVMLMERGR